MAASNYYKAFFQCTQCGEVHKIQEDMIEISDNIYSLVWCNKCKDITNQLYVGSKEEELYELYDNTLDNRFYQYYKNKTK